MRDVDLDTLERARAVLRRVSSLADKRGLRAPPAHRTLDLAIRHVRASGQQSLEAVAEEVLVDFAEDCRSKNTTPEIAGEEPSNGVASLVLVVAFKSVVEQFRTEVWGEVEPPFQSEDAACIWLELLYRSEREAGNFTDSGKVPMFRLNMSESGLQIWPVQQYGVMEKLHRLRKTIAAKSEWWSTDSALKFVLLGWMPGSVGFQTGGFGNYTKKITITVNGPVPEAEVLRAYRRACESAYIKPQALSRTQHRILVLVHHLMPTASWTERYKVWLEWCEKDETLTQYSEYRNLRNAYKEAMKRQSWTGETPRLLRPGAEFEQYWAPRIGGVSVKKPPDPVWEEPDFDTSGFEPPQVDQDKLEAICQEAARVNPYPHEMTTFWEYYHRN